MVNAWKILGIAPTDDLSAIKKAYSQKLKLHHPEDDPEGYQRLREAYDYLSKEIKKQAAKQEIAAAEAVIDTPPSFYDEVEEDADEEDELPEMSSFINLSYKQGSASEPEDVLEQFLDKAEALYNDFQARIDEKNWLELLDDDILWNINQKQSASTALLHFIQQHHAMLPKNIWLLLENHFQWQEFLEKEHPQVGLEGDSSFLDYYKRRTGTSTPYLSFGYAAAAQGIDYDEFLSAREEAFDALLMDDWELAESQLQYAAQIFSADPDLLRMIGHVLIKSNRREEAIAVLRNAIDLQPEDIETTMFLARVLYEEQEDEEASAICSYTLKQSPDHHDAASLLGKILFRQGKLEEAREQFLLLRKLVPFDAEAVMYLADIHNKMLASTVQDGREYSLSIKELQKELYKTSFMGKASAYFWGSIRIKVFISLILLIRCTSFFADLFFEVVGSAVPAETLLASENVGPAILACFFLVYSIRTLFRTWNNIRISTP
ncbi:J domain-containing protein [Mesobacillus zeae]|nr:J domain-containing protein [Mesobacillus zeae]